jgi:hypothetical protein
MLGLASSVHTTNYIGGVAEFVENTRSIQLDGVGDYIKHPVADSVFASTNGHTISAWVRYPDPYSTSFGMLYGVSGSGGATYLGNHGSQKHYFWLGAAGSASNLAITNSSSGLTDGVDTGWIHMVTRVQLNSSGDPANNTNRSFWIDADSKNSGNLAPNMNNLDDFSTSKQLGIGVYSFSTSSWSYITNQVYIAEFAIFDTALTDGEIQKVYEGGGAFNLLNPDFAPSDNLVTWYRFEDDNTDQITDYSGNDNHGEPIGDPSYHADTP